jgi:hypothetical protein
MPRGRPASIGALLLLGTLMTQADACEPAPDGRPLLDRLAAAPVLFVGRVTAVTATHVTLAVESAVRGTTGRRHTAPRDGTCGPAFAVGEHWIFAGAQDGAPSVRITRRRDAELVPVLKQFQLFREGRPNRFTPGSPPPPRP